MRGTMHGSGFGFRRALAALLILLGCALPAAAEETSGLDTVSGLYAASGKAPGGQSYQGIVKIVPYGRAHAVLWKLSDGQAYKGLALQVDDVLGAAYGLDKVPGLVVYRIKGGTLEGTWISGGGKAKAELGRENLQGPEGLNGAYQITLGENQDGTTNYSGEVDIKPDGATYVLLWKVPKPAYLGRGVRIGNVLVVAFGKDLKTLPGVVGYRISGDTLAGAWATGPSSKTGSETLIRKPQ